jgi:hypothetical protein
LTHVCRDGRTAVDFSIVRVRGENQEIAGHGLRLHAL